jgi:hypothetical protein
MPPPLNGPFHRANLLAELPDQVAVVLFRAPGPNDSVLLSVYEQVALKRACWRWPGVTIRMREALKVAIR